MPDSAEQFLLQGTNADDFLKGQAPAQQQPPAHPRQTRTVSADEFLQRADMPAKQGFWEEFGEATGGAVGLATAPLDASIPAESVKWAYRNREEIAQNIAEDSLNHPGQALLSPVVGIAQTAMAHLSAFLDQPVEKPLTERMKDSFRTVVQSAKEHPGLVAGSLLKGIVADPELFFLPELGAVKAGATAERTATALGAGAKTAQAVGTTARVGTKVGTAAGLGGGTEAMREAGEGEPIDTGSITLSAAIGTLAAGLQLPFGRRAKPQMTPAEIDAVLATQPNPRAVPQTDIVPTHDGYAVQTGGRQVMTFPTKELAEEHAAKIRAAGSAYSTMGVAPPGSAQAQMSEALHENPFPKAVREGIKRPNKSASMSGAELAKFWGKAAGAAAIGAGVGALLDDQEPAVGATFGAAITLLPRALPKDKRISVEELVNLRNGLLAQMARRTFQFKSAIDAAVPEPTLRNAISLAMERPDAGIQLNPAQQQVAASARAFFDAMGNTAVEAGVVRELLTNYVTHIVEEDPRANPSVIGGIVDALMKRGGDQPKSGRQFAKVRQYATFEELQAALSGSNLKIKTADIGELVAIYSKAMFRTITDKRLLDALKTAPVDGMQPHVLPPEAVRGPPPSAAPQLERQPLEGEATAAPGKLPAPQHGGPPAVPPRPGEAPAGNLPKPDEFQLPNPPPDQPGAAARKFAAKPRYLVQPIEQMDSNYKILPNRQLAGFAVHQDIAPQLNFIFSNSDPLDATVGLMALNQASKRALISFSLFHAKSLSDAFIGAMGLKGAGDLGLMATGQWRKTMTKAALDMFLKGGNNDDIHALLGEGLQVQVPEDVKADEFYKALQRGAAVMDKVLPVNAASKSLEALNVMNEGLEHLTFSVLQSGFKLVTALDALERLTKKGVPRKAAARMAASYANDIYGGLDWFRVANDVSSRLGRDLVYGFFSPTGRRWMQIAMFAPDWTFSTFRAAYKALPGAVDDPALAALHRRYLAKSALYYLTVGNAINFVTAGHSIFSNANPTRIQLADGRTMQYSKHFMEPFEWLKDPIQTADNKLAFLPRALVELGTGKEYISAHDTAPDIQSRALTVAKMFLPIYAQQGLAGGGAKSAMGLVGMPVYGMTPEEKLEARKEKKLQQHEKKKKAAEYRRRLNQ